MQDEIISHIPEYHRPIFVCIARQWIRPAEARALQHRDFDLNNELMVIRRSFSMNILRETTKTDKIRVLPIHPDVKEMLEKMPKPLRNTQFVFPMPNGRPYSENYLPKLWREAVKKAGFDYIRLYSNRHSGPSIAAIQGESIAVIQKILGHTSINTTMRYTHADNIKAMKECLKSGSSKSERGPKEAPKGEVVKLTT